MAIYTDLDLTMKKHPVTKDLVKLTDDAAVKRSILNLLQTQIGDYPFHPEKSGNLEGIQFEIMDYVTMARVERTIREIIGIFEPRAKIMELQITAVEAIPPGVRVQITIAIINTNSVIQIDHYLTRVR